VRFLYIYKAKKCFFPACIFQSIEQLKISGEEKASFSGNIQQIKDISRAYFLVMGHKEFFPSFIFRCTQKIKKHLFLSILSRLVFG